MRRNTAMLSDEERAAFQQQHLAEIEHP